MPLSENSRPPARIAVIGVGNWGRNLARNFAELGVLAAVCDRSEAAARDVAATYGVGAASQAEILRDPSIDAVVIAAPAELHAGLAENALTAGKHVFVEKPLALDVAEAERLVALANRLDRILMVGHLLQYHPAFRTLAQLVAEGQLGRLRYLYSNRLNLGRFRTEENTLWSFAPHDISMILSLVGSEPESVLATGHCYLHHRLADVTTTHLQFPSGVAAHLYVSWLHPFKEQRLVAIGDAGMAVFDDGRDWPEKLMLYPHRIEWRNGTPVPSKAEAVAIPVPQAEPLRAECQHFLDCLRDGAPPRTDGPEGLRVLRVLHAAEQSIKEGRPIKFCNTAPGHFVHETAAVDMPAEIGDGTRIWHFSHVLKGSRIGRNCNIGQNVVIGPDVSVGDGCKIQNNVSVYKGVTLEDGVFCGPSMVFTNVRTPRAEVNRSSEFSPTLVRRGATIGANATIVCGITIGQYAFIGAGAVVIRDVPDHAVMVGNPARRIGYACRCGISLPDGDWNETACGACGTQYRRNGETVVAIEREPSLETA